MCDESKSNELVIRRPGNQKYKIIKLTFDNVRDRETFENSVSNVVRRLQTQNPPIPQENIRPPLPPPPPPPIDRPTNPQPAPQGSIRPPPPISGFLNPQPAPQGSIRPPPPISGFLNPQPAPQRSIRPPPPIGGLLNFQPVSQGNIRPSPPVDRLAKPQ